MKKWFIYLNLLFVANVSHGQVFTVSSGTVSLGSKTTLTLDETSLTNEGDFIAGRGSEIIVNSIHEITIKGLQSPQFYSFVMHGNVNLETDLTINGNLILNSGLFNLNNSNLWLNGQLIGENNSTYIYSEGSGEIIKVVDLTANQKSELGFIGLEVTSNENLTGAEFRRGHLPQYNGSSNSISRYFKLPPSEDNFSVSFSFLNNELNNLNSENLSASVLIDNIWYPVNSYSETDRADYIHADLLTGSEKITLFESASDNEIFIPGGISPNNDSQNDVFIISGIENYPDNKLIIFNRWGEILIEKEPYENNWGGENENGVGVANENLLPDGTYFYIFFKDKNDKKSVLKGSFEIKSGN